ncbi:MAG: Crp/Fnr family transcriptional regulator [Gallionellaceae bacterium]
MIDSNAQLQMLQLYPMLNELPSATLTELFSSSRQLSISSGTIVFDENQACQGFSLVLSGCIRVIKAAASGRELQLYRVTPGESCILTSSCLLGHVNYQARGLTEQDTNMIVLTPNMFETLLSIHKPFRDFIFALFSERITDLMLLVSAVAFQKLDQRLAALLANKISPIATTHQALADELGSVREIVSRLLKNFAEQGWIRLSREQIEIIDADALKNFSTL